MNLFQKISFISHAGLPLNWKIECDALSEDDWKGIARMIMDYEKRPFGSVEGIPRGGIPLAKALSDPTRGLTALSRSGVLFTDAQKEMILSLKESGK